MTIEDNGIAGPHWVRYGIAGDQKYLLGDYAPTYDQLVVNASMIAHMPTAISLFISQKLRKPYIIDPQTHVFQHDINYLLSDSQKSSGKIKRSWKGLIGRYGAPLNHICGDGREPRSLRPSDLRSEDILHQFCRNVLTFQRDEISQEAEEGPDADYIRFLAEEAGINLANVPPSLLIPPYFFLGDSLFDQWLDLTLRCFQTSRNILSEDGTRLPLACQLVISRDLLSDKNRRDMLISLVRQIKPDAILLWIDEFSEHQASVPSLVDYITLVADLSHESTPVVNLYGGFFSVAQSRLGKLNNSLRAICHGLEYGETKPVIPISGGIAVSRFYSNNLHHRLPPRQALREVTKLQGLRDAERFHSHICDCAECLTVITHDPQTEFYAYLESQEKLVFRAGQKVSMEFPTAKAAHHCTSHYMWCKAREYAGLLNGDQLKEDLKAAYKVLSPDVGERHSAHALRWASLL